MILETFKEIKHRWKDALQIGFLAFLVFAVNGFVLGVVNSFFGSWLETFRAAVEISVVNKIFLGFLLVIGYICIPLLAFSLFKLFILDTLTHGAGHRSLPWKKYLPFFLLNVKFMLIVIGLFLIWNFIGQLISMKFIIAYAIIGALFLLFFVYPWMLTTHLLFWFGNKQPLKEGAKFVHSQFRKISFMIGMDIAFNLLLYPLFYLIGMIVESYTGGVVDAGFNQNYAFALLIVVAMVNLLVIIYNQFYMYLLFKRIK